MEKAVSPPFLCRRLTEDMIHSMLLLSRVDVRIPGSKMATVFTGDKVAINAWRNNISRRGRDMPGCCEIKIHKNARSVGYYSVIQNTLHGWM